MLLQIKVKFYPITYLLNNVIIIINIWKNYHICHLQESISIIFSKIYLKTFLSGENTEGQRVH